jgi:hypothetical protein
VCTSQFSSRELELLKADVGCAARSAAGEWPDVPLLVCQINHTDQEAHVERDEHSRHVFRGWRRQLYLWKFLLFR